MNKKIWQKKEKDDAKSFGGSVQIASGALWSNKLDIKTDNYLIEAKTTEKLSYSVKRQLWEKINKSALLEGRTPLLSIRFSSKNKKDLDLVVLSKDDFIVLTNS